MNYFIIKVNEKYEIITVQEADLSAFLKSYEREIVVGESGSLGEVLQKYSELEK